MIMLTILVRQVGIGYLRFDKRDIDYNGKDNNGKDDNAVDDNDKDKDHKDLDEDQDYKVYGRVKFILYCRYRAILEDVCY